MTKHEKPKKKCYLCEFRGEIFRVHNFPHCHCGHPSIPEIEWGWGTLRTIFEKCELFIRSPNDRYYLLGITKTT
jgi:hypothetical protein